MTRAARERNATLPVNRTIVSGNRVNRDTCIPSTLSALRPEPVALSGYSGRKGKSNGQHVGMWGTLSQNYKTPVTIDVRWSQTVTNHG